MAVVRSHIHNGVLGDMIIQTNWMKHSIIFIMSCLDNMVISSNCIKCAIKLTRARCLVFISFVCIRIPSHVIFSLRHKWKARTRWVMILFFIVKISCVPKEGSSLFLHLHKLYSQKLTAQKYAINKRRMVFYDIIFLAIMKIHFQNVFKLLTCMHFKIFFRRYKE